MKTVIIYATRHGCTEKCAHVLKGKLDGTSEVINIKKVSKIDMHEYETIIIGGSIHIGKIQKKIKKFCQHNLDILSKKKLGLFVCCMEEGETAHKQFQKAYPEALIQHASATGIFGGEFNFERMIFIEKAMIKKVAQTDKNIFKLSKESIQKFVKDMK